MCAAPASIAVFEFLDSTHREIQAQIRQLHALVDTIESSGPVSYTHLTLPTKRIV